MAAETRSSSLVIRLLDVWGDLWLRAFALIGGVSWLAFDVAGWIWKSWRKAGVRLGRAAVMTQIVRVGIRSIGIVMLVAGCIGVILALQMAPPLAEFGQTDKTANIIGIAILRELGPLIAAIVLTGFAGASIAAEIGTMAVNEELEALEAHALNPIRFLVVPRVIATTIALVVLTIIGDLTSVVSGGFIGVFVLDVPFALYRDNTLTQLEPSDFLTGLVKATVFGAILGSIACYNGLKVSGGAAGVGLATTNTVVQTVVSVVLADLLFTALFYSVGWN